MPNFMSSSAPAAASSTLYRNHAVAFVMVASLALAAFAMYQRNAEFFGLELFSAINFLFCIYLGTKLFDEISFGKFSVRLLSMVVGVTLSFVATVLMAMSTATLHQKMRDNNRQEIPLPPSRRQELDGAKRAFVATTVFLLLLSAFFGVSNRASRQSIFRWIHLAESSYESQWIRIGAAVTMFLVGAALAHTLGAKPCATDATVEKFSAGAVGTFVMFLLYSLWIGSSLLLDITGKKSTLFYAAVKHVLWILVLAVAFYSMDQLARAPATSPCLEQTSAYALFVLFFLSFLINMVISFVPLGLWETMLPALLRYGIPLALMATSAYLVYITNSFTTLSAEEFIR